MIQKKSVYVIDAIADETTSLVRKGSTVRLSSGKNEWVLLSDWDSGAFSSASKYSISGSCGMYSTTKTLSSKNQFDISIGGGDLSALVMVNAYNDSGDEDDKTSVYIAALGVGVSSANVIKSNGITASQINSSNGTITIINGAAYSSQHDVKIIVISNSEEIDFDSITDGDESLNAFAAPQTGYNDSISDNSGNIATNSGNIALRKQSQTDYTTLNVYSDSLSVEADEAVSYLRVGRSTNITHVSCETSEISLAATFGAVGLEFDFNVNAVLNSSIIGIGSSSIDSGATYDPINGTVVSTSPLKILTNINLTNPTDLILKMDFSILGTW